MIKYRILKETRRNGEVVYTAQYKKLLIWKILGLCTTDIQGAKIDIADAIREDLRKVIKKEIVPYPENTQNTTILTAGIN